jgi:hypothetical protein
LPTVAGIAGVRITMYSDEHPPPHYHARFGEFEAMIEIDTLVVRKGRLPRSKLEMVLEWAAPRRALLAKAWDEVAAGRKPGRIP